MKTETPNIKKLAVEIYKAALRGTGQPLRNRTSWDDLCGNAKKQTEAIAKWHLREVKKAVDCVVW